MYNANAIAKYIEIPGSSSWLWMLNGDRVNQMKRWLTNRLAYLDSKYDYNTDEKESLLVLISMIQKALIFKLRRSIHQVGYLTTITQQLEQLKLILLGKAALNHTYASGIIIRCLV